MASLTEGNMKAHLRINGGSKEQKQMLRECFADALKHLGIHRLMMSVTVKLNGDLEDHEYGFAESLSEDYFPRDFLIEINRNLSNSVLLKTFLHELVHVKQYARRELTFDKFGNHRWKGRGAHVVYRRLPWEREAFKRERIMYTEIVKG